jgi:sporulation protein YlmC with PRC-barrel domain
MKRITASIAVVSIVGLLSTTTSFAQQREGLPSQRLETPLPRPGSEMPALPKAAQPESPPVPKASALIGSNVVNPQGENLGKIEDLVIDLLHGRIKYAALSHGTILGLGGKLFAISWDALELSPDGETFILNVPKEQLENATGFDKSQWPTHSDPLLSAAAREGIGKSMPSDRAFSGDAVSAMIEEINAPAETITLRMRDDETVVLQAPVDMLMGLQAGDVVEVRKSGNRATDIRRQQ